MATLSDVVNSGTAAERILIANFLLSDFVSNVSLGGTVQDAAGAFTSVRKAGQTSGYLVPAGRKFVVKAVRVAANNSGVVWTAQAPALCTSTADAGVGGADPAGRLAHVPICGASEVTAGVVKEFAVFAVITAGFYLTIQSNISTGFAIWEVIGQEMSA